MQVANPTRSINRLLLHTVPSAVVHMDIIHILHRIERHNHHTIFALLASHVVHKHVANRRIETSAAHFLWLIVEIDFQHRLLALTYFHIAEIHILNDATSTTICLDAKYALQIRTVHRTVLHKHLLTTARDLRTNHYTAMSIFHDAVADDKILRRQIPLASVRITSTLDGDAVVARVEGAAFNQHILA